MDRSARFWDKIAERYAKRPVPDEDIYQKKLQITRDYLHPEMELLEFGCGTGSTAISHAPYVKHVRATDISQRMIDIARQKADEQGIGNISFEKASFDELDVPDQSLDAVLGLNILQLMDDTVAVAARIHGMLKPGGVFVSSAMCLGDSMHYFKLIGPVGYFLGIAPKLNVFTSKQLDDCLRHAGFEIEQRWHPGGKKAVFIIAKKPA